MQLIELISRMTQNSRKQKPVTHAEKALPYVEKALTLVQERLSSLPEDPSSLPAEYKGETEAMFLSLTNQLKYVKSVLVDSGIDRSKLHQLTLGNIAAKEFEEVDPELFKALIDVNYIAVKISRGLKIDLQALEEPIRLPPSITPKS